MRKANFDFGYERNDYDTTNRVTEKAFLNKETGNNRSGLDASERKKGMTKSRIYHGRERTGYSTTTAANYTEKNSDHVTTQR